MIFTYFSRYASQPSGCFLAYYDANGNTLKDPEKNFEYQYNSLNLLSGVMYLGSSFVFEKYIWAADGTKIGVKAGQGDGYGFAYLGSMAFRRTGYEMIELESAAFPEGRFITTSTINAGWTLAPVFHVTDHLGSVRAEVDGASKAMLSANDYMPFGERFSADGYGQRGRYLFSGKEKQTTYDLNLLDFGARMYDSKIPRWMTQDPLAEKYYSTSPQAYALNNPVNAIDPDGRLVIFINGNHDGSKGGKATYWDVFDKKVMNHLQDYNARYYDGSLGGAFATLNLSTLKSRSNLSSSTRYNIGYETGQRDAASILAKLARGEKIKVITHSMGAAYGKGFVQALIDMGIDPKLIEFEADFAPFQPTAQRAVKGVKTFQFSNENDDTANNRALGSPGGKIKGADVFDNNKDPQKGHAILDFWNKVNDLPTGDYNVVNGQIVPVRPKKK